MTTPGPRLLVVDRESASGDRLCSSLSLAGFDVHITTEGASALRVARQVDPSLVVLDVTMPDLDVFAVPRLQRGTGRRVPVEFLSARGDTSEKVAGLAAGGDDYLTTPVNLDELIARIRAVLRRSPPPAHAGPPAPVPVELQARREPTNDPCLRATVLTLRRSHAAQHPESPARPRAA